MNIWGDSFNPVVALIVVPMFALAFYGFVSLFLHRRQKEEGKVNWTPLESAGIAIAIYFVSQIIGGIIIGAFLSAGGKSGQEVDSALNNSNLVQFFFVLIVEAITVSAIWWFVRRRQTALRLIGVVHPKLGDIGYALAGIVGYFVLYLLVVSVVSALVPGLNVDQKQELGFDTSTHGAMLAIVFFSLVILPPLAEEFLCRGFLFSGLRSKLQFVPAALVTSGLFAAAHLQAGSGNSLLWVAALDTFTLSLVLVYLREKSGSLWPGIWVHMAKNLVAFLVLFVFHSA